MINRDENMNVTQAEIICGRSCQREASSQIYLSDYEIAQYVMLQSFLESQKQTAEYQSQVLFGMATLQTKVAGNVFVSSAKYYQKLWGQQSAARREVCLAIAMQFCGPSGIIDDAVNSQRSSQRY